MGLFKDSVDRIKKNKLNADNGRPNSIPFPFERFNKYVPGIIKGHGVIVTAGSGVGKTQLAKFLYVYSAYKYYINNKDKVRLKIFYIALEESKEEMMLGLISNYLLEHYDITISILDLQSYNQGTVTNDLIEKIEEASDYFTELVKILEVVDYIFHPTGIYKYIENYALNNGRIIYRKIKKEDSNGVEIELKIPHHYEANDKDEYVLVLVDHVSLMEPEKGNTLHQTLSQWSFRYARKKLTKFFNYTVVNIQQQSAESEAQQFDMKGGNIVSKLLPSLANLANNKETQRDAHLILGLFSPYRFKIQEYEGYNIVDFEDNFRSLIVLKNRMGASIATNLFFNGKSNFFKELPKVTDMAKMNAVNNLLKNIRKNNN